MRKYPITRHLSLLLLMLMVHGASPARAQERRPHDPGLLIERGVVTLPEVPPRGLVEVHESTFNDLARAVLPLHVEQHLAPIDVPGCNEIAGFDVKNVSFNISRLSGVTASGNGSGSWCGVSFDASFTSAAHVVYDDGTRSARVTIGAASVSPTLTVPGWLKWSLRLAGLPVPDRVTLRDFTIDLGRSLGSIPPIPLQSTDFTVETASGPRRFTLAGQNVQLITQEHHLELRADLVLR